jgi:FkbM family methyltransferase
MQTTKFNQTFLVSDTHIQNNFFKGTSYTNWENDTFHILEYYKNHKKSLYLDIGAWIGPTVLYSANIYNKVIAIEPDTVAIKVLKDNISINNYNNITLIEKGLSNNDGKALFGGNGDLGNSMSSLVIANTNYELVKGFQEIFDHSTVIEINTITIETLIEEQNINPEDISLIKMDIEGGEIIVVPHLINFLKKYKPVFYISLHYVFAKAADITAVIDILFEIYDKCFIFDNNGNKKEVDKISVINDQNTTLVFEQDS